MPLERVHDDVWIQAAPQTMYGLRLGTRMTVVRLPGGELWVHSPIPLDEALRDELRELGPVAHVVAPNLYHHLHVGPLAAAFAGARVHAPPGLRRKRTDLRSDADLGDGASFGGVLTGFAIAGTWLEEVVFHHRPSNLLICADLLQNFTRPCPHLLTRAYLKLGGVDQRPGVEWFLRVMFRDRARARAGVDAVLATGFDGIVLAHGEPIAAGGREVLAASYVWLK